MERVILGVSKRDRIKNNYIREKTGAKDIIYTIKKLKVKYAGHVARQCETRWPRKMMEWIPWDQKRGRGRPATRWRDDLVKEWGVLWARVAQDRGLWRGIGEAYAQKWVLGSAEI